MTTIGIKELRASLSAVVRDVNEGRRPMVVVTNGRLPVVAIVPVLPDGTLAPSVGPPKDEIYGDAYLALEKETA